MYQQKYTLILLTILKVIPILQIRKQSLRERNNLATVAQLVSKWSGQGYNKFFLCSLAYFEIYIYFAL